MFKELKENMIKMREPTENQNSKMETVKKPNENFRAESYND